MFRKSKANTRGNVILKAPPAPTQTSSISRQLEEHQAMFESWPLSTPEDFTYSFEWEGFGGLFLGVTVLNKLDGEGLVVKRVDDHGAAHENKVKVGDILASLNGRTLPPYFKDQDFASLLHDLPRPFTLGFYRPKPPPSQPKAEQGTGKVNGGDVDRRSFVRMPSGDVRRDADLMGGFKEVHSAVEKGLALERRQQQRGKPDKGAVSPVKLKKGDRVHIVHSETGKSTGQGVVCKVNSSLATADLTMASGIVLSGIPLSNLSKQGPVSGKAKAAGTTSAKSVPDYAESVDVDSEVPTDEDDGSRIHPVVVNRQPSTRTTRAPPLAPPPPPPPPAAFDPFASFDGAPPQQPQPPAPFDFGEECTVDAETTSYCGSEASSEWSSRPPTFGSECMNRPVRGNPSMQPTSSPAFDPFSAFPSAAPPQNAGAAPAGFGSSTGLRPAEPMTGPTLDRCTQQLKKLSLRVDPTAAPSQPSPRPRITSPSAAGSGNSKATAAPGGSGDPFSPGALGGSVRTRASPRTSTRSGELAPMSPGKALFVRAMSGEDPFDAFDAFNPPAVPSPRFSSRVSSNPGSSPRRVPSFSAASSNPSASFDQFGF